LSKPNTLAELVEAQNAAELVEALALRQAQGTDEGTLAELVEALPFGRLRERVKERWLSLSKPCPSTGSGNG
jgi:hypothetical protein